MTRLVPGRAYNDFGLWDKFKMFWLPTWIEDDRVNWDHIYYKIYQGYYVVIARERYH